MSRVAVVTGGARGLGWAIGTCLRDEGWQVVAADLVPGEAEAGETGIAYRQMDVCDRDQVSSTLAAVVAELGSLDLLVNNAGITRHRPLVDLTWDDWSAVVDVNLHGAFRTVRRAVRGMVRARWGRIVLMSSMTYAYGAPGQVNYGAAKAGMLGMARSLAWELGPRNITVNVVAPGLIDTDMSREITDRRREHLLSITPLGHSGQVEDVAAAVRYLTGDSGRYVTGAVLPVSGGLGLGG